MNTETQTQMSPEFQALISRVQEIGKANHENLVAENRKMMAEALAQVTGGFRAPVADPAAAAAAAPVPPAPPVAQPKKNESWLAKAGLTNSWEPVTVPITKEQALGALATPDDPGRLVKGIAERGLQAIGIEAAYERGLVQAPKKGLETWQAIALGVLGATVVAGAATGVGMYVAEVGPFAPERASR